MVPTRRTDYRNPLTVVIFRHSSASQLRSGDAERARDAPRADVKRTRAHTAYPAYRLDA